MAHIRTFTLTDQASKILDKIENGGRSKFISNLIVNWEMDEDKKIIQDLEKKVSSSKKQESKEYS